MKSEVTESGPVEWELMKESYVIMLATKKEEKRNKQTYNRKKKKQKGKECRSNQHKQALELGHCHGTP